MKPERAKRWGTSVSRNESDLSNMEDENEPKIRNTTRESEPHYRNIKVRERAINREHQKFGSEPSSANIKTLERASAPEQHRPRTSQQHRTSLKSSES